MLKLSIIIPVYKVEKYVEKCLRSCAEQDISSDEYEIIVVNDGSPDKSLEIVENVEKEYSNIVIVSQENQGLSLARNKGLSLAKGDYVWFVDSDDWIEKNILKKLITLCKEKDLDILHFCRAHVRGERIKKHLIYEKVEKSLFSGRDALLNGINPCAPFSIYKRKFLLENNLLFYPGIFHEDLEFSPRAWYVAERCMFLNAICYYVFCQNFDSITRSANPKKAFDLIKVCENLNNFSKIVEKKYIMYFHNAISVYINNSLMNSYRMNSVEIKKLNSFWKEYSYLFMHLKASNKFKYKIEYYLFRFLPFYCEIYKFIQYFNKNREPL